MTTRLTRSELEGATLRFLLVLTLRGKPYRFASVPVQVPYAAGRPTVLQFLGGLIAPTEFVDEGADSGEAVLDESVACEVLFGDDAADGWAAIADADHDLGDATGELSIWRDGDDYDDREVLLSGMVAATTHGDAWTPVAFSLVRDAREGLATIPPEGAQVDETTWPTDATYEYDEAVDGEPYPEVFGDVGLMAGNEPWTSSGWATVNLLRAPALLVRIDKVNGDNQHGNDATFLLGVGHLACVGTTARLHQFRSTGNDIQNISPTLALDGRGRLVTVAVVAAGSAIPVTVGEETWWSTLTDGRGGRIAINSDRTSARSLQDVLLDLVGRCDDGTIDAGSLDEAGKRLAGWRLDFAVNDRKSPLDLILDDILPLTPVSLNRGKFTFWQWDADAADAIEEIDTSTRGGYLDGTVARSAPRDVRNQFRIEYAADVAEDIYRRALWLGPDLDADEDREPHPYATASVSRYGLREDSPITTDLVADPGTAYAVLEHRMRRLSMTHRTAAFVLPQAYQHLQPGAVVLVSHAPIAWSQRVCLVRSVARAPGDTRVVVETCTDWIRDAT